MHPARHQRPARLRSRVGRQLAHALRQELAERDDDAEIADGEFSMAELQGHLMRHKTDPVTAVEAVADLRESVKREREEWHALAAAATARPVRDEEGE